MRPERSGPWPRESEKGQNKSVSLYPCKENPKKHKTHVMPLQGRGREKPVQSPFFAENYSPIPECSFGEKWRLPRFFSAVLRRLDLHQCNLRHIHKPGRARRHGGQ